MEIGHYHFKAKHVLFKEGQQARSAHKILTGKVLCLKFTNGRLVPLMMAKKGDVIGEEALIAGGKYSYSAIVLEYSEIHPTSGEQFNKEFKDAPPWMAKLISTMLSRLHNTAGLLADNRIIHPSVFNDQDFGPSLEIEYKRLLGF